MAEQSFTSNGTFVVPAGVTSVQIECWGWGQSTGKGSYAKAVYATTPGESLTVKAGGGPYMAADVRQGGTGSANRIIVAGAAGDNSGYCEAEWASPFDGTADPDPWEDQGNDEAGMGFAGTAPGLGSNASGSSGGSGGSAGTGGETNLAGTAGGSAASGGTGGNGATAIETGTYADKPTRAEAYGGRGGNGYAGGGGGGAQAFAGGPTHIWARAKGGGTGSSYTGAGTSAVTNTNNRNGSAIVKISWGAGITNNPPNAPAQLSPVDGAISATTDPINFSWQFSDPEASDTQSRWQLQIRPAAGATTIDIDSNSPPGSGFGAGVTGTQTSVTMAGGTLSAGNYEWRILTYDQAPLAGSWSAWEPFTTVTPPTAPVITAPANASTITTGSTTVTWTVTNQHAYRVRRVLNSDSSVLWDSGVQESAAARSHVVTMPTDNQTERIEVQVRYNGFWSSWTAVTVTTDFVPPMTPTIAVTTNDSNGSASIAVTHPTPSGGAPAVVGTDLWVRVAAGGWQDYGRTVGDDGIRIIADSLASTLVDDALASTIQYEYRVQAKAANGTATWSAWSSPVSVQLYWLLITRMDTVGAQVAVPLGDESYTPEASVEQRLYANGRLRGITKPGITKNPTYGAAVVDPSTQLALESVLGILVLVRSPRGGKTWGMIPSIEFEQLPEQHAASVSFDVLQITHIEEV